MVKNRIRNKALRYYSRIQEDLVKCKDKPTKELLKLIKIQVVNKFLTK